MLDANMITYLENNENKATNLASELVAFFISLRFSNKDTT